GRNLIGSKASPTGTKLQEADGRCVSQERFFRHDPSRSERRKVAPLVLILSRAISTHCTVEQIPVLEIVGNATEVRQSVVTPPVVLYLISGNLVSEVDIPRLLFIKRYGVFRSLGLQLMPGLITERCSPHNDEVMITKTLRPGQYVIPNLVRHQLVGLGYCCVIPLVVIAEEPRQINLAKVERVVRGVIGSPEVEFLRNDIELNKKVRQDLSYLVAVVVELKCREGALSAAIAYVLSARVLRRESCRVLVIVHGQHRNGKIGLVPYAVFGSVACRIRKVQISSDAEPVIGLEFDFGAQIEPLIIVLRVQNTVLGEIATTDGVCRVLITPRHVQA